MNAIDELRNLLEVFYEGRATAKDVARIRELFASVADLPDDLVADREVIDALSDPDLDGTVVPDEVGDMMIATIDSLPSSGKGISSRRIWLGVGAAAASIALIMTVGIAMMRSGSLDGGKVSETPVVAQIVDSASNGEDVVVRPEDTVKTEVAEVSKSVAAVRPVQRVAVVKPKPVESDVNVVSDVNEAEAYTRMAMTLLADNCEKAGKAGDEAMSAIDNVKQTLNDILK